MRLLWTIVLLAACSGGPTVEQFDPTEAEAGMTLTVFGDGFEPSTTLMLENEAGERVAMENLQPGGSVVLKGDVPKGLEAGSYRLVVVSGANAAVAARPFTLKATAPDEPCGGDYTANTQVSLARKLIVVDRFYKDGAREVMRTPFKEVTAVEIDAVKTEKGVCSVVYIRKEDGTQLRYAESLTENLAARAYKFGNELNKPVNVLHKHEDVTSAAGK